MNLKALHIIFPPEVNKSLQSLFKHLGISLFKIKRLMNRLLYFESRLQPYIVFIFVQEQPRLLDFFLQSDLVLHPPSIFAVILKEQDTY